MGAGGENGGTGNRSLTAHQKITATCELQPIILPQVALFSHPFSHLHVARLSPDVVDVRPLEPRDDEVHPLGHNALLNPAQPVEHDCTVSTVHCTESHESGYTSSKLESARKVLAVREDTKIFVPQVIYTKLTLLPPAGHATTTGHPLPVKTEL